MGGVGGLFVDFYDSTLSKTNELKRPYPNKNGHTHHLQLTCWLSARHNKIMAMMGKDSTATGGVLGFSSEGEVKVARKI